MTCRSRRLAGPDDGGQCVGGRGGVRPLGRRAGAVRARSRRRRESSRTTLPDDVCGYSATLEPVRPVERRARLTATCGTRRCPPTGSRTRDGRWDRVGRVRLVLGRRRPLGLADPSLRPLGTARRPVVLDAGPGVGARRGSPGPSAPGYVGWCALGHDNLPVHGFGGFTGGVSYSRGGRSAATITGAGGASSRGSTSSRDRPSAAGRSTRGRSPARSRRVS